MRRLAGGFSSTQILYTAAKLRVADCLADGPRSVAEIARAVKAEPQSLHRFLRMMVVLELLVQEGEDSFGLSPLGEFMRADHPESIRGRIILIGEISYPTAQSTLHAVTTGRPAFDHTFGAPIFEYLDERPELGTLFHEQMSQAVSDRISGLVDSFDFSNFDSIVDIGGGNGEMLAGVLAVTPHARGVLFDLPSVIADAQAHLSGTDVADRIELVEGDFLRDPLPRGGDLYVMSNIVHDWEDGRALQILSSCRAVIEDGRQLLLVEELMPTHVADAPATVASDFSMLLLTGGQERTESEYRALLAAADFELTRVIPVSSTRIYSGRRRNWAILVSEPRA